MKKYLPKIIGWVSAAVIIFLAYWFTLPAINFRNIGFWIFLIFAAITCLVCVCGVGALKGKTLKNDRAKVEKFKPSKPVKYTAWGIGILIVLMIIAGIVGLPLFNAGSYKELLPLSDGNFTNDVAELNMSQIPVVDRDSAERLGSRKLGEMSDLVSQFEIESDYTQINYQGKPVRVTPLAYGDIIKLLNNQKAGLPGYITVDMTTQETTLVRLDNGMKYSHSDILMRDLNRHLRFKYPTAMFDDVSFEIDENGTPFWVASVVTYRVGLWSGTDISGAVLCNAITGECQYFDVKDIPDWVDQVYSADLVIEQLNYNGLYTNGFWNSVFGQSGVLQTTEGYNYIAIDNDVWLYTGMTSVVSDESNVGFVLVNMRTKEGRYYPVPGAEEYSAMASAEGQVQNLKYVSTFPLLLNVGDRPTYFMSLKDDAGLVKMYAFVDVESYHVVATGDSIDEARNNYMEKLKNENVEIKEEIPDYTEVNGTVEQITSAVIDGNTKYYFTLTGANTVYIADISVSNMLPFTKTGDTVLVKIDEIGTVHGFEIK